MKKYRLLLLAIAAISPFTMFAQLTSGIVAHWDFNGTVADVSSNGHNGTANNITYGAGKNGASNTAAIFNGTSSYIDVAYKSDLNLSKYTFCAVIKPTGYYTGLCEGNYIFERGTQYAAGSYSMLYFDNPYNACGVLDTSKEVFAAAAGNTSSTNGASDFQYSPNVVTHNWYCVVTVFDSVSLKVYVNGVLKSTTNITSGSIGTNNSQGLRIGAKRYGQAAQYPYWLNAYLDDLRIYDRAFTASEVAQYCGLFDTVVYVSQSFTDTLFCEDDTVSVPYGVTSNFQSGNVFTAQLSDASGSFASPTNIGSLTSSNAGTIACTIPGGLTPSTNYRIRILSTLPQRTSNVSPAITVHPTLGAPTANVTANPSGVVPPNTTIMFTAVATNAGTNPTYQWFRNGTAVTGATSNTWSSNTLNDNDSVWVVVYSSNMCPPDLNSGSNKVAVKIESSVYDIVLNDLQMYPNPNKGVFTISATSVKESKVDIVIFNSVGQLVYSSAILPTQGQIKEVITLQDVASGVYLLRMSADDKQKNIRFIVK